jgi:hypothetical protein
MKGRCKSCRFAEPEGKQLYCHRAPPAVVPEAGIGFHFPFPAVADTSWCGEFKRAWMRLFKANGA